MDSLAVFAPAKVNLHLAVKDKRSDGFHNLESVFAAVDFGDTLFFSPLPNERGSLPDEDSVSMEWDTALTGGSVSENYPCAVPDNIILRALSLFKEQTGFSQNFSIKAVKRIPIGGGLGGGSSDAAATLLTLNKIAGFPAGIERLLEMGASLGSDVPFFLRQIPAAWVTGRGECIEPIKLSKMFLVLVNPGFPSETAKAFKLLDKYRESQESPAEAQGHRAVDQDSFFNSFLPVFDDDVKAIYNEIISRLLELGAGCANLSGAGSTCFGVFKNKEPAQRAVEALKNDWRFVIPCSPLE